MKQTTVLTAAQLQASQDRRERFSSLAKMISEWSQEQRQALASQMSATTIEGHPLSVHNACLLYCQRQAVTLVGGFNQWRGHGRQVRKGEKGLMIWAPKVNKGDILTPDQPVHSFVPITVFDVSQTDPVVKG